MWIMRMGGRGGGVSRVGAGVGGGGVGVGVGRVFIVGGMIEVEGGWRDRGGHRSFIVVYNLRVYSIIVYYLRVHCELA